MDAYLRRSIVYDALGKWVEMTDSLLFTGFQWEYVFGSAGEVAAVYSPPTNNWLWGAAHLGGRTLALEATSNKMDFVHDNALGSTSMKTGSSGNVVKDLVFYPRGQIWQDSSQDSQPVDYFFASMRWRDTLSGDMTDFRHYSFQWGRWISPDPLAGDITNPQSLNRYAYVMNNPTTLTDPLGLQNCRLEGICGDRALEHLERLEARVNGFGSTGCTLDNIPINCGVLLSAIGAGITNVQAISIAGSVVTAPTTQCAWSETTGLVCTTGVTTFLLGTGDTIQAGPGAQNTTMQAAQPPKKPTCFEYYLDELTGGAASALTSLLVRDPLVDKAAAAASSVMYDTTFRAAAKQAVPGLGMTPSRFAFLGRTLKWAGVLAAAYSDYEALQAIRMMIQAKMSGGCTSPTL
jgi:RHS repeat-associated protein